MDLISYLLTEIHLHQYLRHHVRCHPEQAH
jgi:hypothetical protein